MPSWRGQGYQCQCQSKVHYLQFPGGGDKLYCTGPCEEAPGQSGAEGVRGGTGRSESLCHSRGGRVLGRGVPQ